MTLTAPFPWFGGKRRVAEVVWQALGDVGHYVEPFAGSLAVLLARPASHSGTVETVNDLDAYLVNFWRALQHDPAGVAEHANNPVNETDLTARHIWLVNTGAERLSRLTSDPDYYDVKVAGWWVWGLCCWIGGGWCSGSGPWSEQDGQLVHLSNAGRGVNRQLAHLGAGRGVNRKRVYLSDAGRGVNRKLVHLGDAGQGVNRKRVHDYAEKNGAQTGEAEIAAYLSELARRLRYVRVCCGDWRRVVTSGALSHGEPVGVFLDPPYDTELRDGAIYNTDQLNGATISAEVRQWCLANGDNPRYRIALCGYEGEHDLPDTWRVVSWSARRAYGRASGDTPNSANRHKERVWLSPHCTRKQHRQITMGLFQEQP